MNHGFKLHPDGTLEITMPKGVKVGRVLVCEKGTQNGTLMYPDCDDCIKHGGDWECDRVNCHIGENVPDTNVGDMISRQAAINEIRKCRFLVDAIEKIRELPSAQPERLTDDDFETIRIHLNAYKEKLCNQQRWEEAEEYQRIIDRFMAFASEQPRTGKWHGKGDSEGFGIFICDNCGKFAMMEYDFCPNCGADM